LSEQDRQTARVNRLSADAVTSASAEPQSAPRPGTSTAKTRLVVPLVVVAAVVSPFAKAESVLASPIDHRLFENLPGTGSTSPTLTGPEIEHLLRANLTAAPGAAVDPSHIRCPSTREYGDGDVARCSVPVANGAFQILLVTLFREPDGWSFNIDIQ
jgi:hypothetical protein